MRGFWLAVVIGLLSVAGVTLLNVFRLLVTEVWRDHHPKQPKPEPPRRIRTSQEIVIENLRRRYFDGQIESDEFEAGLWRAMTGADTAERIAGAEAIAGSLPERDEVFRIRREARVKELENSATPNRIIVENNEVWRGWMLRDDAWVKARGDK